VQLAQAHLEHLALEERLEVLPEKPLVGRDTFRVLNNDKKYAWGSNYLLTRQTKADQERINIAISYQPARRVSTDKRASRQCLIS